MTTSTCAMDTSLTTARLYTDELQSVVNRLDTGMIDRIAEINACGLRPWQERIKRN
jgi:hypothetical protein